MVVSAPHNGAGAIPFEDDPVLRRGNRTHLREALWQIAHDLGMVLQYVP
jgi:hypothetical protein